MIAALLSLALAAQTPSPVRAVLVGLDGSERGAPLAQLDTRDPREQQAWRVRFEGGRAPALPRDAGEFRLWSGERLRGAIKAGKQESLVVQTGGVGLLVDLDEI